VQLIELNHRRRDDMGSKLITAISLVFALAAAAAGAVATPASATPTSPGACNMLHTNLAGYLGMLKASEQGLGNMMALVIASEESGCVPH
jgi:hypothetical protein